MVVQVPYVLLILILVCVDHECPTIALVPKTLYPQLTHNHQRKLQRGKINKLLLYFS
jgi:hypothetical protein